MNVWECDQPWCDSKCVGTGGAIGLRAVGWWFEPHKGLFCPRHRPDKSDIKHPAGCGQEGPCSLCSADREADTLQYTLAMELGSAELAFHKRMVDRWR